MSRPSSIDQLPEEIRTEIGRLRQLGWTIDQILEHLRGLIDRAPSRSALGRHIQKAGVIGERLRHTREIAKIVGQRLDGASASHTAQMNIEITHTILFDLMSRLMDGGEGADAEAIADLITGPDGLMKLSRAQRDLAQASKGNIEFLAAAEKRATEKAKREAATAAEAVARERGISGSTLEAIKASILGVRTS